MHKLQLSLDHGSELAGFLLHEIEETIAEVNEVEEYDGYPIGGSYAASNGAVLTMMKSCARALGDRGIAVNAVAPGFIDTPFVASAMSDPVRRWKSLRR